MVLAKDGLCYPKRMLMQSQKAHPYHRPAVSHGDRKAIRQAAAAQKRLISLTKATGAYASRNKPKSCAKSPARRAIQGGTIAPLVEITND